MPTEESHLSDVRTCSWLQEDTVVWCAINNNSNSEKTTCNFTWKRPISLAIYCNMYHNGHNSPCWATEVFVLLSEPIAVPMATYANTCPFARKQKGIRNAMQRFATLSWVVGYQWSHTSVFTEQMIEVGRQLQISVYRIELATGGVKGRDFVTVTKGNAKFSIFFFSRCYAFYTREWFNLARADILRLRRLHV
jgi:hypothetical protein